MAAILGKSFRKRPKIMFKKISSNLAAKHKSGPIKISAAGRNSGRIFGRFLKKWQKSGQTFLVCVLHIKALII
jgi:hypothetical protein